MGEGQLVITKYEDPEHGTVFLKSVDEELAARLPDLRLPRIGERARAAFRAILAYEKPSANGSVVDVLHLTEARGYCASMRQDPRLRPAIGGLSSGMSADNPRLTMLKFNIAL